MKISVFTLVPNKPHCHWAALQSSLPPGARTPSSIIDETVELTHFMSCVVICNSDEKRIVPDNNNAC